MAFFLYSRLGEGAVSLVQEQRQDFVE